jgi:SAM-dependent methyltransferase
MESSLVLGKEQIIPGAADATARNRSFYDGLWSGARLADPSSFNTWPLVQELLPQAQRRLEVGPGLRPRLPIPGSHFIDLSPPVIAVLKEKGGEAQPGSVTALPFPAESFDLVCALDVVEHVEDDLRAFSELSRVVRRGGELLFSVPLHEELWTPFDAMVGHVRRYHPERLLGILEANRFSVVKSARFGMQPSSSRLLGLGLWLLAKQPAPALFCYNWLFLPLRLRLQKQLRFLPGMIENPSAAELILLCRRD